MRAHFGMLNDLMTPRSREDALHLPAGWLYLDELNPDRAAAVTVRLWERTRGLRDEHRTEYYFVQDNRLVVHQSVVYPGRYPRYPREGAYHAG